MVMDLVAGTSLRAVLRPSDGLEGERVARLAREVREGLMALHETGFYIKISSPITS